MGKNQKVRYALGLVRGDEDEGMDLVLLTKQLFFSFIFMFFLLLYFSFPLRTFVLFSGVKSDRGS